MIIFNNKLNVRLSYKYFPSLGMAYLTLPEAPTAKAAAHFLTHAIMQSPHLQTFIQPIGQELVCAIMHCVGMYSKTRAHF